MMMAMTMMMMSNSVNIMILMTCGYKMFIAKKGLKGTNEIELNRGCRVMIRSRNNEDNCHLTSLEDVGDEEEEQETNEKRRKCTM